MHQLNTHPPGDTDSASLEPDAACGAAGGGGPAAHTGERSASTLKATRQGPRGWESTGHDSLTEETRTSKLSCGFGLFIVLRQQNGCYWREGAGVFATGESMRGLPGYRNVPGLSGRVYGMCVLRRVYYALITRRGRSFISVLYLKAPDLQTDVICTVNSY